MISLLFVSLCVAALSIISFCSDNVVQNIKFLIQQETNVIYFFFFIFDCPLLLSLSLMRFRFMFYDFWIYSTNEKKNKQQNYYFKY